MRVVIESGKIYTMRDQKLINDGIICIEDEMIKEVGSSDSVEVPQDTDLKLYVPGMSVFPGFIDAHLHVGSDGHPGSIGDAPHIYSFFSKSL